MKPKAPERPTKRIVVIEATEAEWRRFLEVVRRHGWRYTDDPAGVLDDLPPRPAVPVRPSDN